MSNCKKALLLCGLFLTIFCTALPAAVMILDRAFPPVLSRYQNLSPVVLDENGKILRAFTVENGIWRLPTVIEDVSADYIAQLIAFEDKRFFNHRGVDFAALARAAFQAVRNGKIVSGGSTLTMQTARLLEPRPRNISAKLIEMLRAWQLEAYFGKREILQIYLTLAPMGGNLEGLRAAAMIYFGKEPSHLTPAEAALLVALPQSPTALRPDFYPARAKAARNKVLMRVLPQQAAAEALDDPLPQRRKDMPFLAPHLSRRLIAEGCSSPCRSFVKRDLQAALEKEAREFVSDLPRQVSTALVVVENDSGHVIAYVGSAGFFNTARDGQVDMAMAVRSPGSALKPFIYGIGFQDRLVHPATTIHDGPAMFGGWAPRNFLRDYAGDVSIAKALQLSLNVPAVKVLEGISPARFASLLAQAGGGLVTAAGETPALPLALGGAGIKLEQLAQLYAAVARGGDALPLRYHAGQFRAEPQAFLSPEAAGWLTTILRGVENPSGFLAQRFAEKRQPIAFKTGTSYGFRDAVAIGFSSRHTVAAWVGRPDGAPHDNFIGLDTARLMLRAFDLITPVAEQEPLRERSFGKPPAALRHYPPPPVGAVSGQSKDFRILFPPKDAMLSAGKGKPVILEADAGKRPYTWLVNGAPAGKSLLSGRLPWQPDGAGAYNITAIDATGAHDSIKIWLQNAP